MTVRLSTGLRKARLGNIVCLGSEYTYTLADNGASPDTITSTGSNFLTKGFYPGMDITLANCTTEDNDVTATLTAAAAGTLTVATGSWNTGEVLPAVATITGNNGGSLAEIFNLSVLRIYSGTQPSSADAAETGTLLVEISDTSQTFVPTTGTYGLQFQMITDNSAYTLSTLAKLASQTWSGVAVATGTAGYARLYDVFRITGSSYVARRLDLSVSTTSNAQVVLPSLTITSGRTVTIDTCAISQLY